MAARTRPRTARTPKNARVAKQLAAFLEAFETCGTVIQACRRAKVARSTVYKHRQADEAFADAWRELEDEIVERMEAEALRRAVEGVPRTTLDKDGNVIRDETVYSDTLLIFLLKARKPATYRDNVKVEHTGEGGGPVVVDVLGGRDPASVSPAARKRIERELAKEQSARDRNDGS